MINENSEHIENQDNESKKPNVSLASGKSKPKGPRNVVFHAMQSLPGISPSIRRSLKEDHPQQDIQTSEASHRTDEG
uniref:Uncharacterized protein n=1 Tax=Candidatus Kentrum sp. LFY TaxID=2126342 RepID=A0A450UMQ2_9GAMM|nr:MAG: hypothetical protein BECKLFY1418B_GA0070995_10507 [Candidatus Kentron sp. LFY]